MQEHDRYPRTLVGTYLKDYSRGDLYGVSPEHIGNILANILIALAMLAVWTLICVMSVPFVRAVIVGGDDIMGAWLRSLEYLARVAFCW